MDHKYLHHSPSHPTKIIMNSRKNKELMFVFTILRVNIIRILISLKALVCKHYIQHKLEAKKPNL